MNTTLMPHVRSLLTAVDMPYLLCREAFLYAIEIVNIISRTALDSEKTPSTRRFGSSPE